MTSGNLRHLFEKYFFTTGVVERRGGVRLLKSIHTFLPKSAQHPLACIYFSDKQHHELTVVPVLGQVVLDLLRGQTAVRAGRELVAAFLPRFHEGVLHGEGGGGGWLPASQVGGGGSPLTSVGAAATSDCGKKSKG